MKYFLRGQSYHIRNTFQRGHSHTTYRILSKLRDSHTTYEILSGYSHTTYEIFSKGTVIPNTEYFLRGHIWNGIISKSRDRHTTYAAVVLKFACVSSRFSDNLRNEAATLVLG